MTLFASKWLGWKAEDSQTPDQVADRTDKSGPFSPSVRSVGSLDAHSGRIREARTPWDEARERQRLDATFDWADEISPPGCWTWCSTHRPDLRVELDGAYDAINHAFTENNPTALSRALARFGTVVRSAVSAYRGAQSSGQGEPSGAAAHDAAAPC